MKTDRIGRSLPRAFAAVLAVFMAGSALAQEDGASSQVAMIVRIKELLAESGRTRFVAPMPGSRSAVVSVDTSRELYFYLERGSIRGSSIDAFYVALESGDAQAAYDAFVSNAIMILRVTDYGWNGLGVPIQTGTGRNVRDVPDVLFKDSGGAFTRVSEITAEDIAAYEELLQTVIQMLEGEG